MYIEASPDMYIQVTLMNVRELLLVMNDEFTLIGLHGFQFLTNIGLPDVASFYLMFYSRCSYLDVSCVVAT